MSLESHLVHFTGHVQGVGFRYNTMEVAKRFDVTGYVRNLADGRVELVAEGEAEVVEQFVAAVCERMDQFIQSHSLDRRSIEVCEHQGFIISHAFG